MPNVVKNEPTANILMISMRAIGYTFESAMADILDNSISACANSIQMIFPRNDRDYYLAICDNGYGMTSDELFNAMRYGSDLKGENRLSTDLGRFGLGLKSASLSQVRKLTVVSKKNNKISAYCWDLDYIQEINEWSIIEYIDKEIETIKNVEYLDNIESGTIVIWEKFDFIEKRGNNVFLELDKKKEEIYKYVSLIFHRYIETGIIFKINNRVIDAIDPFLREHNKTKEGRKVELIIEENKIENKISVTPYILPFQKDMTREDNKKVGGIENYKSKQGFYIYRGRRLIIWGTWFGQKKEELTKNVRVKVDIPNTLDEMWGIDIKKQSAVIPLAIRKQLKKLVDEALDMSKRMYSHRGRNRNSDDDIDYIWDRLETRDNEYKYKINRKSRLFNIIKNDIDDAAWSKLNSLLSEIEESLPYQQIYIDRAENRLLMIEQKQDETKDNKRLEVGLMLIEAMIGDGNLSKEEAIQQLFKIEPFNNNLHLIEMIRDRI